MLSMSISSTAIRSSMELMLDALLRKDEQPIDDSPPALPTRPASMARFPPARRGFPILTNDIIKKDNVRFSLMKITAAIVIQRHTRGWIAWTMMQRRKKAVLCLQHGIRDWLSRRHLDHAKNIEKTSLDDHVQRQLFKVENELVPEEVENKDLVQVQQWLQYDERIKSLENCCEDHRSFLKKKSPALILGDNNGDQFDSLKGNELEELKMRNMELEEERNKKRKLKLKNHLPMKKKKTTIHKKWWRLCLFHLCFCLNLFSRSIDDEDGDKYQ